VAIDLSTAQDIDVNGNGGAGSTGALPSYEAGSDSKRRKLILLS